VSIKNKDSGLPEDNSTVGTDENVKISKIPDSSANLTRRDLLKKGGALGAGLSLLGIGAAGYAAGTDTDSYTGWERYHKGEGQFFDRKPFETDKPVHKKVGDVQRIQLFERLEERVHPLVMMAVPPDGSKPKWTPAKGINGIPEKKLREYYQKHPQDYKDLLQIMRFGQQQAKDWGKYKDRYAIADAWSAANGSLFEYKGVPHDGDKIFPREPVAVNDYNEAVAS